MFFNLYKALRSGFTNILIIFVVSPEAALEDAESALRIDPSSVKGFGRKAAALGQLNRWQEAIDLYQTAIELSPQNSELKALLLDAQKNQSRNVE
jgi:cytochrome c-type biogenesis protein CcmH/NrfG